MDFKHKHILMDMLITVEHLWFVMNLSGFCWAANPWI